MEIWFEIPTKSGVVKIEVPELPASVGSDPSAEVRLRHPSVAAFHALIHASEDGISISSILPSNALIYEGDDYRSIRLDDGDRIKIGEVPVLVRIEEDEAEDEDQDEAEDLAFDDTDDDSTAISDDGDDESEEDDGVGTGDTRRTDPLGNGAPHSGPASLIASEGDDIEESSEKCIRLAAVPPPDYPRLFLTSDGSFKSWLTMADADTVTSYFLLRYCTDWRQRGLVSAGDSPRASTEGCVECGANDLAHWPIAAIEKGPDPALFQIKLPLEDGWIAKFAAGVTLSGFVYAMCICRKCGAVHTLVPDTSCVKPDPFRPGKDMVVRGEDARLRKGTKGPSLWWGKPLVIDDLPEVAIGPGISGTWFLARPSSSSREMTLIDRLGANWPVAPSRYSDLTETEYEWERDTGETYSYRNYLRPADLASALKARRQRLMRMQKLDVAQVEPNTKVPLKFILDVAVELTAAWARKIEQRNSGQTS